MTTKRLYRDVDHKIIGGVAAGIAEYFNIDPVAIRIAFVLLGTIGGGVLIYLICWIVIPQKEKETHYYSSPGFTPAAEEPISSIPSKKIDPSTSLIGGIALIFIGALFLADHLIPEIRFRDFWPVILIIIGAILLFKSLKLKK